MCLDSRSGRIFSALGEYTWKFSSTSGNGVDTDSGSRARARGGRESGIRCDCAVAPGAGVRRCGPRLDPIVDRRWQHEPGEAHGPADEGPQGRARREDGAGALQRDVWLTSVHRFVCCVRRRRSVDAYSSIDTPARAARGVWQISSAGSVLQDVVLKTVVLREPRTGAAP